MSHVKGQSMRNTIPKDLDTKIEWDNEENSNNAIEILIRNYEKHTNQSIYIKLHSSIIAQLQLQDRDSISVGFNQDYSMFGIRKDSRGVQVRGNETLMTAQSSCKKYNEFEEDTMWVASPKDTQKTPNGDHLVCLVSLDNSRIEKKKNDNVWKTFLDSTVDHVKTYIT